MNEELEQLFTSMMHLGKIVAQKSQISFEERNATMLQFAVLSSIKEQPKTTMGELASNLQLSVSSATQLIERLVKANFVERVMDQTDRRITRIALTDQGFKEHARIREEMLKTMEHIFSKIPQKDRSELIRIHIELIASLKGESSI